MEGGFLAACGHRAEGLRRNGEPVSHAAALDHHVIGPALEHLSADRGDQPAAPASTGTAAPAPAWLAWQMAIARASAAWSDSGAFGRPSRAPTIRWT